MQSHAIPLVLLLGLLSLVQAGEDMNIHFPGAIRSVESRAENLMSFSGAIGGVAPAISPSGNADRPFLVKGNQFRTFADAWERSCGEQKNICGDFANSADGRSKGVTVNQCDQQNASCLSAEAAASPKTFGTPASGGGSGSGGGTTTGSGAFTSQDANFDYFCEG